MRNQNNANPVAKIADRPYCFSADVVRTIAIIGVVIIHTADAVYRRPDFFGGISWWIAIILNSFSRISIPFFIMLSGYFLLNKNETFAKSLKRTINRIIIPLIFWLIIYIYLIEGNLSPINLIQILTFKLLTVNVYDLYFLIILAGLYIVAPIIRTYLQKADNPTRKKIAIFTLLSGIGIFAAQYLLYMCSPANSITYWIPYVGLFIAGYFLGNNSQNIKNKTLIIIYFFSLSITIVLSYLYYFLHNQGNYLLGSHGCLTYYSDSFLSINVVPMALCAFLLIFRHDFKSVNSALRKLVFSIARNSLGIYVLHAIFLNILDSRLHLFDQIAPAWIYILIKWFIIFTLSYVSSVLLMKIPFLNRTLGNTK